MGPTLGRTSFHPNVSWTSFLVLIKCILINGCLASIFKVKPDVLTNVLEENVQARSDIGLAAKFLQICSGMILACDAEVITHEFHFLNSRQALGTVYFASLLWTIYF